MIHIYLYGALCWDIGVGVVNLVKWLGWCNWVVSNHSLPSAPLPLEVQQHFPNRANASKFLRL